MEITSALEEVRGIVLSGLKGYSVKVYLFGSRLHGNTRQSSDIDVAILPLEPLPHGVLSIIRENLEESHVPYCVDLIDISQTDTEFSKQVMKEGKLWYG